MSLVDVVVAVGDALISLPRCPQPPNGPPNGQNPDTWESKDHFSARHVGNNATPSKMFIS